ncbi:MAG TPA: hypothetical protein VFU74_21900 [Actinocrinis sp.]|nr:hypothetical protein [Actinocrinis sp.]
MSFWSDDMDLSMYRHGTPEWPHNYAGGDTARGQRECTVCHQWRPPVCESITCHPVDRPYLNEQLPTARVYGEPLPDGCLILEDPRMTRGTLRVRIEGRDMVVTLGQAPEPRWVKCDPVTGVPIGALR